MNKFKVGDEFVVTNPVFINKHLKGKVGVILKITPEDPWYWVNIEGQKMVMQDKELIKCQ